MTGGVVYFAMGEQYVAEAVRSAQTVKRWMPELPRVLFAAPQETSAIPKGLFDTRLDLDPTLGIKAQKISVLQRSPFDHTLYLDTDTYMVAPVPELFDLLSNFDLALAVTTLGRTAEGPSDVPISFPVMNTGVIIFRRCNAIAELLDSWQRLHANKDRLDQPSFRRALFHSDVRFAPLSNSHNFLIDFPQTVRHPVKILHGRHQLIDTIGLRVQPIAEVSCVLPVHYLDKTVVLGKKTLRARPSELLRGILRMARPRGNRI